MLTKLEAVNRMLVAGGETRVSSLSSGLPEAEDAEVMLDEIKHDVLGLGWAVASDEDYVFTRDEDGYIDIPDAVLRVDTMSEDRSTEVVPRYREGQSVRSLYNKTDATFVWTKNPKCYVVWNYEFAKIPSPALQTYIAARAAREYQASDLTSVSVDALIKRREDEAWVSLLDAEAEQDDSNFLTQHPFGTYATRRNSTLYGR